MKPSQFAIATAIFFAVAANANANASNQITSRDSALKLAIEAVHKFHLTTLKDECGSIAVIERAAFFEIVVREVHSRHCGGSVETAPRLFSLRVMKADGQVTSDVYDGTSFQPVNRSPDRPQPQ